MREKDVYDTIVERVLGPTEPWGVDAILYAPPPLPKCLKRAQRKLGRLIDRGARSRALKRQAQRVARKAAIAEKRAVKS